MIRALRHGTIRFDGAAFTCYVLADGRAVLGMQDVATALGLDHPQVKLLDVFVATFEISALDGRPVRVTLPSVFTEGLAKIIDAAAEGVSIGVNLPRAARLFAFLVEKGMALMTGDDLSRFKQLFARIQTILEKEGRS